MAETKDLLSFKLGQLFTTHGFKLAVAESCTGGLLASEITAVPGCSVYFDRGWITYTDAAKRELLKVPSEILEQYGAVSEAVAAAMARGALAQSQANIAVSITGIAGPAGATPQKPVGFVCFGLARKNGVCMTCFRQFQGGRDAVRRAAVDWALAWLIECVSHATEHDT